MRDDPVTVETTAGSRMQLRTDDHVHAFFTKDTGIETGDQLDDFRVTHIDAILDHVKNEGPVLEIYLYLKSLTSHGTTAGIDDALLTHENWTRDHLLDATGQSDIAIVYKHHPNT